MVHHKKKKEIVHELLPLNNSLKQSLVSQEYKGTWTCTYTSGFSSSAGFVWFPHWLCSLGKHVRTRLITLISGKFQLQKEECQLTVCVYTTVALSLALKEGNLWRKFILRKSTHTSSYLECVVNDARLQTHQILSRHSWNWSGYGHYCVG